MYAQQEAGSATDIGIVVYWTLMSAIAVFTFQAVSMLLHLRKSLFVERLVYMIIYVLL